jgi:hypothetical protein
MLVRLTDAWQDILARRNAAAMIGWRDLGKPKERVGAQSNFFKPERYRFALST